MKSLPSAGSATEFLVLTVLLLLFKSSYMLIYPIVMELGDQDGRAGSAAKFHAVHHTAVLLASLAGAGDGGVGQFHHRPSMAFVKSRTIRATALSGSFSASA